MKVLCLLLCLLQVHGDLDDVDMHYVEGADSLKIMQEQDRNITNLLLIPRLNLGKSLVDMIARHNGQLTRLLSLARDNDTVALQFVKRFRNSTKPQFLNVTQRIQSKMVDWRVQFKLTPIQVHDIRDMVYECRSLWSEYKHLKFHVDGFLEPKEEASKEDYTSSEYSGFGTAIPVTVAQGERSFSKLEVIKNYLRSTLSENNLTNLAIISIERDIKIETREILNDFAARKAIKIDLVY